MGAAELNDNRPQNTAYHPNVFQIVVFICTIKKLKIGKDNYVACTSVTLNKYFP
jgi:hypothetical protein